jgi:chromosome segregation ATPase
VAPERKRSARDYEQALRRQELAAGRALVQALGAEGSAGPRELAAARRVLTQSLFELRRLGRDLDQEIEGLRARSKGAAGAARPAAQRSNPGELERLEAVRNAVEEVAERWEGRRDQLSAELDRRQPRQARQPRRTNEVRNRGGAAPARPGRPQSPRSRRSRG